MTIQHKGIRRKVTDVLDDYGQAQYLQNVRLKRVGELGRRAGLGKSNMAQLAGPVQFMIGAWSNTSFIVNGTSGTVTGQEDPLAYWTADTKFLPLGAVGVGTPVAPTIDILTSVPAEGVYTPAYPTFVVTPTITYDGLSGPLTYLWEIVNNTTNPSIANPLDTTCSCDASAAAPGVFDIRLTVTTLFNPAFSDSADTTTYTLLP